MTEGGALRAEPFDGRSEEALERILACLSRHFDVTRHEPLCRIQTAALAHFFSRSEKYAFTRQAKLWAAENSEYIFFFFAEKLIVGAVEQLRLFLPDAEGELVRPHGEHMSTVLSAVVIAGGIEPEAARSIRRFRFHKNYRFSFYGWCTGRIAAVCPSTGQVVGSRAAGETGRLLRGLFRTNEEKGGRGVCSGR